MGMIDSAAVIHKNAQLADDVVVGAFAIIEEDVRIDSGTIIRQHAIVRKYTRLGKNNVVDSFTVLGGEPQDLKFDSSTKSYVIIGDNNTFREGVTISRATGEGEKTIVGNNTLWMANSHAGHNSVVKDNVIFVNGALIAGHCTIEKNVILPANGAIHQFCWIGENVMFQGGAFSGMHVPPFVVCSGVNNVVGLNSVGLKRRPDITPKDRREIKEAFRIAYRSGASVMEALAEMDLRRDWGNAANTFRSFLRRVFEASSPFNRGLCPHLSRIEQRHK